MQTHQATQEWEFQLFLLSAPTQVSLTETLVPPFPFQIVTQFYVTLTVVAVVISLFQNHSPTLSLLKQKHHIQHKVFLHQHTTASLVKVGVFYLERVSYDDPWRSG